MPREWIDIQLPFCRFRPSFHGMKSRGIDFFIFFSGIRVAIVLFLALLFFVPSTRGETASETLKKLTATYDQAQRDFTEKYQAAKTDEERQKISATYPKPEAHSPAFLTLAEQNPGTPVAEDALRWIVSHDRQNASLNKVLAILTKDHLQSPRLGEACQSLVYAQDPHAELFLRKVLEKNPAHEVQGQAAMSLGQLLRNKSGSGNSAEAENLFERVTKDFADVKSYRGTLGEAAGAQLFEIRNLSIGQIAPDIEGQDVDGKTFKLSEYRGKVLVLDFWGDW